MFAQLLVYVRAARNRGEPIPGFLAVIDRDKAAIMATEKALPLLDNLRRAAEYGAIILPAMPGFYHGVKSIGDLIDFVVARILDQLGIPNALMRRWGGE